MLLETDREMQLRRDKDAAESKYRGLKYVLQDIFDKLDYAILILRFILYVGSVAGSWFYLKDKALAVGIVCSLTAAHVLISFREYLQEKKKEVCKD